MTEFNLPNARPPEEVKTAFDDVNSAPQDKSRIESEAKAYASKIVPEARGAAQRVQAPRPKATRRHHRASATGDAQRFSLLVDQYRKAPGSHPQAPVAGNHAAGAGQQPKVVGGDAQQHLYVPLERLAQRRQPLPPQRSCRRSKSSAPADSTATPTGERPSARRAAAREAR